MEKIHWVCANCGVDENPPPVSHGCYNCYSQGDIITLEQYNERIKRAISLLGREKI